MKSASKLRKTRALLLLGVASLALSACGGGRPDTTYAVVRGGTGSLADVQQLAAVQQVRSPTTLSAGRQKQIENAAMSVGAQSGLAWRGQQIDAMLMRNERYLDKIFNFSGMMIEQRVMPPVLREARNTVNLSNDQALRIADRVYEIKTQAHFVTMPVTWRNYLLMNYSTPEKPDASLLPRSVRESEAWREASREGWRRGFAQAEEIYRDNLSRLKEDFTGMALYRKLLAEGLVSRPFVMRTPLGVTGNKDKLRINDEVLRITAQPELLPEAQRWDPVVQTP